MSKPMKSTKPTFSCFRIPPIAVGVLFSGATASGELLTPVYDSRCDSSTEELLSKDAVTDLAVGPVSAGRYFRTYLTFDVSNASPATGYSTLLLSPVGSERNTSSLEQTFTLFVLDADWDEATQPWPEGTTVATIPFTPKTGGDDRGISFTSAALTTAINNALGGKLYLGIKSDAEGPDARSFLWVGSMEDTGSEPQLLFNIDGGPFATWIDRFFPGETDPEVIGLEGDPDGDGNGNGVENFFGTTPNGFSQGLTAGLADPDNGTFRFTHPQGTLSNDLSAEYRWSKDLKTFYPQGPAEGTTVTFSTESDTPANGITTVTATVTGAPVKSLSVRVAVTRN